MPNIRVSVDNPTLHIKVPTEGKVQTAVHQTPINLTVAGVGPQGPPGPPGSAASTYVHDQTVPSATWAITHNLGYFPNVTVLDSGGATCIGDVVYDSLNLLTLTFSASFAGKAYLS